jgi:iron complex transport system substrate-binding protein
MRTIRSIFRACWAPRHTERRLRFRFLLSGLLGLGWAAISCHASTPPDVAPRPPAHRIVSLAPHVTELLYAAGAGNAVIGVVEYSDYPPEANRLPRVGTYDHPNVEAILRLQPDLVVAWYSGTPPIVTERLEQLHVPVWVSRPATLENIPEEMLRLGELAGTTDAAKLAAQRFRDRAARLASVYAQRPVVRAFYEIWNEPLVSIGGQQILDSVFRLCGGKNVFDELPVPAPTVSVEAVLAENPEVILASGAGQERPKWLDDWHKWPQLTAVRLENLYFVPPDLLQRPTPRILDGAQQVCELLEQARHKRTKSP